MAPPVGITILGGLVVLAAIVLVLIGIAAFFVGLAFLIPGMGISGTTLILNGLLYFAIGVVLGIAGLGLLRLRPWAWGLALLASLAALTYMAYNVYQDSTLGAGISLYALLTLGIIGAVFVYLLSVHRAFRVPARSA